MSKQPVSLSFDAQLPKAGLSRAIRSINDDGREYITHFSDDDPKAPAERARVIPCKPNSLATAAPKEKADPLGRLDDKFAAATRQAEGDGVYGLVPSEHRQAEGLAQDRPMRTARGDEMKLDELPDAPATDAYDDMPVDGFGEAMLRGMGMTGEETTGTVEFIPRPARMGLGAKPTDVSMLPTPPVRFVDTQQVHICMELSFVKFGPACTR
jgi:G-patch domain